MFTRHLLPAVLLSWALQPIALAQEIDLPGWDLVWRDEFDSPSLDTNKWEALTLNNTYPGDVHYYLPEHASVVDGKLRITATDEPIEDKLYRSARLESWQAFGPGRFEARIDLPTGQGMAPAFWLYPNDPAIPWPTGGEIDIMENLGSDSSFTISAYHWQTEPGPCCEGLESVFDVYVPTVEGEPVNFHEGFHIFAAEWDDDEIRYYVDGVLHFTVTETESRPIFETPKNIILNLAVGGNFAGNPDETTVFPQTMDVDYVRVWTRASSETPGDYNGNGKIDAADYTVWRDALTAGATELTNDPTPGTVDESDFLYWRDHFGETLGASGTAATSVPAPTTALLFGLGALGVAALRRWPRQR